MNSINGYQTICRPYLIQRGSFRDILDKDIVGLDCLISYDYMGSSEFEIGTLPRSLRRMTHDWKDYGIFPIEDIKDSDGQTLYLLCRKSQFEEIKTAVHIFAAEKYSSSLRTKEMVNLYDYIHAEKEFYLRINFWWDVTDDNHSSFTDDLGNGNDWMVCFGDDIRRLVIAINKVCEKHKVPVNGPLSPNPKARPVKEMYVEEDGNFIKVIKAGVKTTLIKRSILEVQDLPGMIRIKVRTRSGCERFVEIREKPGSAHTLLFNLVKEWPSRSKERCVK
jgi:hypothetical protein